MLISLHLWMDRLALNRLALKKNCSYYKYKHHCDQDVALGGHASYGRRHVVPRPFHLVVGGACTRRRQAGSDRRVSVAHSHGPAFCRYLQSKLVYYNHQTQWRRQPKKKWGPNKVTIYMHPPIYIKTLQRIFANLRRVWTEMGVRTHPFPVDLSNNNNQIIQLYWNHFTCCTRPHYQSHESTASHWSVSSWYFCRFWHYLPYHSFTSTQILVWFHWHCLILDSVLPFISFFYCWYQWHQISSL